MTHYVVTANALLEGDVVYLAEGDHWTRHLTQAQVFDGDHAADALARAEAKSSEIVGVYLIPVALRDGTPQPTHFREAFRQRGPSNRFHGKQAEV